MHLGGNMKGGDPHCWCPELWEWLVTRYAPRMVLDVGCGEGHALGWLGKRGVQCIGIEGLPANAAQCPEPVIVHDFAQAPIALTGINLVWSCEVVEHVEEKHLPNLLSALCSGSVLAMTAAHPGQGGFHHVNEQPAEYWIKHIEAQGFKFLPDVTTSARMFSPDPKNYFRTNGLLFSR